MRFRSFAALSALAALSSLSCSSKGSSAPSQDDTWSDGKHVTQNLTIPFGNTVTITPGARVTFDPGVLVTVAGRLKAQSGGSHVVLGGNGWGGLQVQTGGALDLDGVDIQNATTAIDVEGGTGHYQHGTISNSVAFLVGAQGELTFEHATVKVPPTPSNVYGTFTAKFVDFDANKLEGIIGRDSGKISVEDSKFHGTSTEDNDLILSSGPGVTVHVAYSEFTAAHCCVHFDQITSFDISHVSFHDSALGGMLYGSSTTAGTKTITQSNVFNNHQRGFEEENLNTQNGAITISDGYWANNGAGEADNLRDLHGHITASNMSTTTQVQGVGPRGAVP